MDDSDTLYSSSAAADFLHDALKEIMPDKSPRYWQQRLINARRTDRKHQPPAIPFTTAGKAVFYTHADLIEFTNFEKTRHIGKVKLTGRAAEALRAFGVGEAGGSSLGRQFAANTMVSEVDDEIFVRLTIEQPFLVFKLSPTEAIKFAEELLENGRVALRYENDRRGIPSTPEVAAAGRPAVESTTTQEHGDITITRTTYQ